jgi:uncharacterized membrane protein HdeD (DUF308 family)
MTANAAIAQPVRPFPWQLTLFEGVAAIIVGILLLTAPAQTVFVLVQLLGIYWLVRGVFSLGSIIGDSTMWGWKLFLGVLGVIAGILVLQHPISSAILVPAAAVWVLGLDGIIMGCVGVYMAFKGGGVGSAILGVLSIIFGLVLMSSPLVGALALPWVLGFFGIIGGAIAVYQAFHQHGEEEHAAHPEARPQQPPQAA